MMNRRHTRAGDRGDHQPVAVEHSRLVLRTTFIVGFPGETEAEFAELLDFVTRARFERLGVFAYSFEPDTPSARLPGHLAEAGQGSAARPRDGRSARDCRVVQPDARRPDARRADRRPRFQGKNLWIGRTYADAPDVDGLTFVQAANLQPGDLAACQIVSAEGYDLVARPLSSVVPNRKRVRSRPKPRKKPPAPLTILDSMP